MDWGGLRGCVLGSGSRLLGWTQGSARASLFISEQLITHCEAHPVKTQNRVAFTAHTSSCSLHDAGFRAHFIPPQRRPSPSSCHPLFPTGWLGPADTCLLSLLLCHSQWFPVGATHDACLPVTGLWP